ncbi:hypothetical protein ILUMI_21425 [Ignelater luminosus]|uniref:Tc1-like transposase DDE domain-containing protein n=1 Tax=Ignelater luminosus TaxID=2038154 RepID=A0A8K0CC58_IGNLU|nr:hypothetical protein ILUMI_21425 [Ignelater luminosus]
MDPHQRLEGRRLITYHTGSDDGFVSDALWTFESKKSGDYHEEMVDESIENWFANVLPKLDDHAVIVLDNAPYHSRKLEKIPTPARKLLKKNAELHNEAMNVGYSKHKKIFTVEQENTLANYVKGSSEIMFGLTSQEVRQIAAEKTEEESEEAPFSTIVLSNFEESKMNDRILLSTAILKVKCGLEKSLPPEESFCEWNFEKATQRDPNNRFTVALPLKEGHKMDVEQHGDFGTNNDLLEIGWNEEQKSLGFT